MRVYFSNSALLATMERNWFITYNGYVRFKVSAGTSWKGLVEHLMRTGSIVFSLWCRGYKRHLVSPSGVSSNQKANLCIYNVSKFSNCFHMCCVIIHINSSGCLDMLCRKHDFFLLQNKKRVFFYCNFSDKNDFHSDEYQKGSESTQYILIISSIFGMTKSFNRFAGKQCFLVTVDISKPWKPQGLCGKTTSDYLAMTWFLDI